MNRVVAQTAQVLKLILVHTLFQVQDHTLSTWSTHCRTLRGLIRKSRGDSKKTTLELRKKGVYDGELVHI